MECSYCNQRAILISGKNYCQNHIGKYDPQFFEQAVMTKFTSKHEVMAFFMWAFGTDSPKLSDLEKWHGKIERVERKENKWESEGIYVESQDEYIGKIADEYLKNRGLFDTKSKNI